MDGKPDRVSERERTNQSPLLLTSCCGACPPSGCWRFFVLLRHEREFWRDRVVALQPNQEIKQPNPPANVKTAADISAKSRVHCWRKPEHAACAARQKENFDELLRIQRVHESKVKIHRAIRASADLSRVNAVMLNGNSDSPICSQRTTRRPARASSAAVVPPPIIATSYMALLIVFDFSKLSGV